MKMKNMQDVFDMLRLIVILIDAIICDPLSLFFFVRVLMLLFSLFFSLWSSPHVIRGEHAMELLPRRVLDHAHPPDVVALVDDQDAVPGLEPELANLPRPERVLCVVDHATVHNRVRVARQS